MFEGLLLMGFVVFLAAALFCGASGLGRPNSRMAAAGLLCLVFAVIFGFLTLFYYIQDKSLGSCFCF